MRGSTRNVPNVRRLEAVAIGASAGGLEVLAALLAALPADFAPPVMIVQHQHPQQSGFLAKWLDEHCALPVREAMDKRPVDRGTVWMAPAGYHLLIERDQTFALNIDARVSWARPSIDVLFDSAARVWRDGLAAALLTGANTDGTEGLRTVRMLGGLTIAQDPATAASPIMPRSAIDAGLCDRVCSIEEIAALLVQRAGHAAETKKRMQASRPTPIRP